MVGNVRLNRKFPEAQFYLGLANINGDCIDINKREGIKWMRIAAKYGDADAIQFLESIGE